MRNVREISRFAGRTGAALVAALLAPSYAGAGHGHCWSHQTTSSTSSVSFLPSSGVSFVPMSTGVSFVPMSTGVSFVPASTGVSFVPAPTAVSFVPASTVATSGVTYMMVSPAGAAFNSGASSVPPVPLLSSGTSSQSETSAASDSFAASGHNRLGNLLAPRGVNKQQLLNHLRQTVDGNKGRASGKKFFNFLIHAGFGFLKFYTGVDLNGLNDQAQPELEDLVRQILQEKGLSPDDPGTPPATNVGQRRLKIVGGELIVEDGTAPIPTMDDSDPIGNGPPRRRPGPYVPNVAAATASAGVRGVYYPGGFVPDTAAAQAGKGDQAPLAPALMSVPATAPPADPGPKEKVSAPPAEPKRP